MFAHGSKGRLTARDLGRFEGRTLFDRVGRAVCAAGCLPRKELYEAWEVARRARRRFRGGRVIDLAGGHGLLAHVMLLLDDTSPEAIVVDTAIPSSHAKIQQALVEAWPRLGGRVAFREQDIDAFSVLPGDVVVSSHACGALTDRVLAKAVAAGARVAVLPCCHDLASPDAAALSGWMDGALAIDAARAMRLEAAGYRVWTQTVPEAITPRNRLLMAEMR